jgi:hypothetical protein
MSRLGDPVVRAADDVITETHRVHTHAAAAIIGAATKPAAPGSPGPRFHPSSATFPRDRRPITALVSPDGPQCRLVDVERSS